MEVKPGNSESPLISTPSSKSFEGKASGTRGYTAKSAADPSTALTEGLDEERQDQGPRRSSATGRRGGDAGRSPAALESRPAGDAPRGSQDQPQTGEKAGSDGKVDTERWEREGSPAPAKEAQKHRDAGFVGSAQPPDAGDLLDLAAGSDGLLSLEPLEQAATLLSEPRFRVPPEAANPIGGQAGSQSGTKDRRPVPTPGRHGKDGRQLGGAQAEDSPSRTGPLSAQSKQGSPGLWSKLGHMLSAFSGQAQFMISAFLKCLPGGATSQPVQGPSTSDRQCDGAGSKRRTAALKENPALFKKALAFQWNSDSPSGEDSSAACENDMDHGQAAPELASDRPEPVDGQAGDPMSQASSEAVPAVLRIGSDKPADGGAPEPAESVPAVSEQPGAASHLRGPTMGPVRPKPDVGRTE